MHIIDHCGKQCYGTEYVGEVCPPSAVERTLDLDCQGLYDSTLRAIFVSEGDQQAISAIRQIGVLNSIVLRGMPLGVVAFEAVADVFDVDAGVVQEGKL